MAFDLDFHSHELMLPNEYFYVLLEIAQSHCVE
jgi:hypothetical protein